MGHDADFRSHIELPLNAMKVGAKGWLSIPTRTPLVDVSVVMSELSSRELLDKVAVNLVPLEREPGMWEILVSKVDLEDVDAAVKVDLTEFGVEP